MTGDGDRGSASSRSSPVSAVQGSSANNTRSRRRRGQRYKTELCRQFDEHGACWYGPRCQFAHGPAELRTVVRHPKYKTDLCRPFHTTGLCPYGSRCHFIHNDRDDELHARRSADPGLGLEPLRAPPPPPPPLNSESDIEQRLIGLILLVLDPAVALSSSGQLYEGGLGLHSSRTSGDKELMNRGSSSSSSMSCGSVASWTPSVDPGDAFRVRNWSNNPRHELIS